MSKIIIYEPTDENEESFIMTHPSSWMLVYYAIIGLLGSVLIIPLIYTSIKMWEIMTTRYYFYEDRMVIERGLFFKTKNNIQWYRIKSIQSDRPLWQQFFGLGSFDVVTSDRFANNFRIIALSDWSTFEQMFQEIIEDSKDKNSHKELNHFAL